MFYDAHVHFDMKLEKPYQNLRKAMNDSSINKCMLILNSTEEKKVFWENSDEICSEGVVACVSGVLDIKNPDSFHFFKRAEKEDLNIAVKLHPRITKITKNDFKEIVSVLSESGVKKVVVDAFTYGPRIENHIGIELAIFLAEKLEDTTIVLAHAGGCDILKCFLMTRPLKNIVYDYSLTCNYLGMSSVRADLINGLFFFNNRIMFGTDFPDFVFQKAEEMMKGLCLEANLSKEQLDNVFYNNAIKFYGGRLKNV